MRQQRESVTDDDDDIYIYIYRYCKTAKNYASFVLVQFSQPFHFTAELNAISGVPLGFEKL